MAKGKPTTDLAKKQFLSRNRPVLDRPHPDRKAQNLIPFS